MTEQTVKAAEKPDSGTPAADPEKSEEKKGVPPGLLLRSALLEETRPDEKGSYGFKGGVIAFVDWEGKGYITPGTRLKIEILEAAGFHNPRPRIEVPFSDGSIKSRRWLRKALPPTEILRSVEENQLVKLEPRVQEAMLKVNRDGIAELPGAFLSQRCARVNEIFYNYTGLCARFRGILSFTDWEGNTFVTPYSDTKRSLLEEHGYVYVESMIKVPYSLDRPENRDWLASHISAEEWRITEKEVEEKNLEESLNKAKKKIEELGLKDLPEELLASCAQCEESFPDYIGMAGSHSGILAFTDALGKTYVTPATREKVELVKSLGYQFMGSAIKVPYSLKTDADIAWLRSHISQEHWDAARDAAQSELKHLEEVKAQKRQKELGLADLPAELLDRSIRTTTTQPNFAGKYFVRNNILGFVDPTTAVYISPLTSKKISLLREANYRPTPSGFTIPYSDGKKADLEFIRRHLSQEELDLSRQESEEESRREQEEKIKVALKRLDLEKIPPELLLRSARTSQQDISLIGHFCSRGGITCFIYEDGYYHVTPTVPWKEEMLKEAGYRPPDHLIRVPFGSGTEDDRRWLKDNLPEGELERSRQELAELERRKKEEEIRALRESLGIGEQVPDELASRSAMTDEVNTGQIGRYLILEDILAFVGPDGQVWITPQTPAKITALKAANYEYATQKFHTPYAGDTEEDKKWRKEHFPKGEFERSREELAALEEEKEEHLAHDIAGRMTLKTLDSQLLERSLHAGKVSAQLVGHYFQRQGILHFIDPGRNHYITPVTPQKLKTMAESGYQAQEGGQLPPHASGSAEDRQWIEARLPAGELERSRRELAELEQSKTEDKVKKNIEKLSLKPPPESILKRSADSGKLDPGNIGRLGIYRGVFAFVTPDERVFVSWYTPEKQETLEDCGYRLEGRLPIQVPYAMPDRSQRRWLMENLPEPDAEEKFSMDENA